MTRIPRPIPALTLPLLAAAVALGGCVTLLPKTPPVQLYQFGRGVPVPAAEPATLGRGADVKGVVLAQVSLPRAALGDAILTVTGDQAAYVAGARWATPAALMFGEDVQGAFEARARRTRLLDRGQVGVADALLRLDVTRFEARYDPNAPAAAPTVLVSLRATLTAVDGRRAVQRVFSHSAPAADNRVGPIVAAFDTAVDATLAEVIGWTDATAPTLAAADAPSATVTRSTRTTQVHSP